MTLIRNPEIGIYGAAISSVASSCTVTIIEMYILTRTLEFERSKTQMIVKPLLATLIMGLAAGVSYNLVSTYLIEGSMATLISIVIAIVVYFLAVIGLKIFDREDYHMLPYGDKIYRILEKIKLVKA